MNNIVLNYFLIIAIRKKINLDTYLHNEHNIMNIPIIFNVYQNLDRVRRVVGVGISYHFGSKSNFRLGIKYFHSNTLY